jgi:hypothetical protein
MLSLWTTISFGPFIVSEEGELVTPLAVTVTFAGPIAGAKLTLTPVSTIWVSIEAVPVDVTPDGRFTVGEVPNPEPLIVSFQSGGAAPIIIGFGSMLVMVGLSVPGAVGAETSPSPQLGIPSCSG